MTEFLVHEIYIRFAEQLFQQTVGISVGTSRAQLLADLIV